MYLSLSSLVGVSFNLLAGNTTSALARGLIPYTANTLGTCTNVVATRWKETKYQIYFNMNICKPWKIVLISRNRSYFEFLIVRNGVEVFSEDGELLGMICKRNHFHALD